MGAKYYVTCLWPGLPELWWRGRWSALSSTIVFTLILNLLLVMCFLYPEWLGSGLVRLCFWIGMGTWVFFVVRGLRELPLLITPRQVSAEPDRFCEARQAYLTSDWTTAEALLGGILAIESRDPSALLLMCGVYRHTNRVAEAQELLDEIKKMEVADAWWLEVRAESMRIERQLSSESANPADDVNPETIEESRMEVSTVETGAENLV